MKAENAQHLLGVAAGSSLLVVTVLYPAPRTAAASVALACFAVALPILSAMFLAMWNTKRKVSDLGGAKWVLFPAFVAGLMAWLVGMTTFFFSIEEWIGGLFLAALGLAAYIHNTIEGN